MFNPFSPPNQIKTLDALKDDRDCLKIIRREMIAGFGQKSFCSVYSHTSQHRRVQALMRRNVMRVSEILSVYLSTSSPCLMAIHQKIGFPSGHDE